MIPRLWIPIVVVMIGSACFPSILAQQHSCRSFNNVNLRLPASMVRQRKIPTHVPSNSEQLLSIPFQSIITQDIPRGGAAAPQPTSIVDPVESFLNVIDLFGTSVFAFSGALKAGKKGMDLLGMMIIATITAVGGGTIRDILMGGGFSGSNGSSAVFWMKDPLYLEISCWTAILTFLLWPTLEYKFGIQDSAIPICTSDALGLAAFAVLGTQKAIQNTNLPSSPTLWILSGLMSATFGGVIRDVICGEPPRIMYPHRTLYATGPLLGSAIYTILYSSWKQLSTQFIASIAFAVTFFIRVFSFNKSWRLPHWNEEEAPTSSNSRKD